MIEFYFSAETITLRQVGRRFGVSHQTVHERMKRAGVELKTRGNQTIRLERTDLERLYTDKKLTIEQTALELDVSEQIVSSELNRHRIEKRRRGVITRKYNFLDKLEVGAAEIITRPDIVSVYPALHGAAIRRGIKISIRTISAAELKVTRIE